MKEIVKKITLRIVIFIVILISAEWLYQTFLFKEDVKLYCKNYFTNDSIINNCNILYVGESSNTSFNPWSDSQNYSISEYLQLFLPEQKVGGITQHGYHLGLFEKLLQNLKKDKGPSVVVLTLNMRNLGINSKFGGNESHFQQEVLFYNQNYTPLMKRIFVSFHFYKNDNDLELEREKVKTWRTQYLANSIIQSKYSTVRQWLNEVERKKYERSIPAVYGAMADAYIKEFGFLIDENDERLIALNKIIERCKQINKKLILHILPENRDYAQQLFGSELTQLMDYNIDFLQKEYNERVELVNNYLISNGTDYTDQFYPTEHYNARIRKAIAMSIAKKISIKVNPNLPIPNNQTFNPDVKQKFADSLWVYNFK